MSLRRSLSLALALPILMAPLGCKDSAPPPPATTATAEAVQAPAPAAPTATAAAHHGKWKGRHGRGIVGTMFRAAHQLELTEPQKATLDKLAEQLHGERGGPPGELKDYHTALVAQVRAGKIETAKLDPLQAAADKARAAQKDREAEALNGLYAALDPAQRKALVAGVRARQAEHPARAGEPDPKRRLEHLTKQLDLDAAQQKRVQAVLATEVPPPAADEMKTRTDAVLTAFEADGFDARKLELGPAAAAKGAAQHAQFLAALLPILKPEQREKLAAGMEKGEKGPRGAHGDDGAPAEEGAAEETAP